LKREGKREIEREREREREKEKRLCERRQTRFLLLPPINVPEPNFATRKKQTSFGGVKINVSPLNRTTPTLMQMRIQEGKVANNNFVCNPKNALSIPIAPFSH
jgi:hypothetical protein